MLTVSPAPKQCQSLLRLHPCLHHHQNLKTRCDERHLRCATQLFPWRKEKWISLAKKSVHSLEQQLGGWIPAGRLKAWQCSCYSCLCTTISMREGRLLGLGVGQVGRPRRVYLRWVVPITDAVTCHRRPHGHPSITAHAIATSCSAAAQASTATNGQESPTHVFEGRTHWQVQVSSARQDLVNSTGPKGRVILCPRRSWRTGAGAGRAAPGRRRCRRGS